MSATDSISPKNLPAHGARLLRFVHRLRSGWTPFADEISGIMATAADVIEAKDNAETAHRETGRLQLSELHRKWSNQKTHIRAYARCLDGLELPENVQSGIDGCRDAQDIRRIVERLLSPMNADVEPPRK